MSRTRTWPVVSGLALVVAFVAPALAHAQNPGAAERYSAEAEVAELQNLAQDVLRLELVGDRRTGSERNLVGLRVGSVVLSRRLDSRTYFAHDERFRAQEASKDADEEWISKGLEILNRLEIPVAEVAARSVVYQKTQVASRDRRTGEVHMEDAVPIGRMLYVTRQVEGLPVFSSTFKLALADGGRTGFLELHWPHVPPPVLREAHHLAYLLGQGWRPPQRGDARVESIEAGIRHSAAFGTLLDIYPTIRVIYAPEKESLGRKLTLYFDRHGELQPNPREFVTVCPDGPSPSRSPKP